MLDRATKPECSRALMARKALLSASLPDLVTVHDGVQVSTSIVTPCSKEAIAEVLGKPNSVPRSVEGCYRAPNN
jgi:hypothetical protein